MMTEKSLLPASRSPSVDKYLGNSQQSKPRRSSSTESTHGCRLYLPPTAMEADTACNSPPSTVYPSAWSNRKKKNWNRKGKEKANPRQQNICTLVEREREERRGEERWGGEIENEVKAPHGSAFTRVSSSNWVPSRTELIISSANASQIFSPVLSSRATSFCFLCVPV